MSASYEDWSQSWEKNVAAVLAEQVAIQGEIEESLRDSDLIGAAATCFEHTLVSYELGDHKEAYSYMLVGQMFMQGAMELQEEAIPQPITFTLPDYYKRGYGSYAEIEETIKSARALLQGIEVEPSVKNATLRDAVFAVCERIFSRNSIDSADCNEKAELLTLAKQLTRHLDINTDEASTNIAFEAFENFMYAGIYANGIGTIRALNTAYAAFEEMQYGPAADTISDTCTEHMQTIARARQFKAASLGGAFVMNIWNVVEPERAAQEKWSRARTTQAMRDRAYLAHHRLMKDYMPFDVVGDK